MWNEFQSGAKDDAPCGLSALCGRKNCPAASSCNSLNRHEICRLLITYPHTVVKKMEGIYGNGEFKKCWDKRRVYQKYFQTLREAQWPKWISFPDEDIQNAQPPTSPASASPPPNPPPPSPDLANAVGAGNNHELLEKFSDLCEQLCHKFDDEFLEAAQARLADWEANASSSRPDAANFRARGAKIRLFLAADDVQSAIMIQSRFSGNPNQSRNLTTYLRLLLHVITP